MITIFLPGSCLAKPVEVIRKHEPIAGLRSKRGSVRAYFSPTPAGNTIAARGDGVQYPLPVPEMDSLLKYAAL